MHVVASISRSGAGSIAELAATSIAHPHSSSRSGARSPGSERHVVTRTGSGALVTQNDMDTSATKCGETSY